jgi:hypothetical protein
LQLKGGLQLPPAAGIFNVSPGWMTECSFFSLSGLAAMMLVYKWPLP